MTDTETIEVTRAGWGLLFSQAALIAQLPLEDWLAAIDRADAIGPILDPTLYRDGQEKMHDIEAIIKAALPLKREVLRLRKKQPRG